MFSCLIIFRFSTDQPRTVKLAAVLLKPFMKPPFISSVMPTVLSGRIQLNVSSVMWLGECHILVSCCAAGEDIRVTCMSGSGCLEGECVENQALGEENG